MNDKLIEALKKLDPSNDNHWTATGEARLDTIKLLCSNQSITRDIISKVAPSFSRSTASNYNDWSNDSVKEVIEPVKEEFVEAAPFPISNQKEIEVKKISELSDLEKKLEGLLRSRAEIDKAINALNAIADPLRRKLDLEKRKQSEAQAIQDYLEAQRKELEKRRQRIQAIKESGINLKALAESVRSPLDAALKQKR